MDDSMKKSGVSNEAPLEIHTSSPRTKAQDPPDVEKSVIDSDDKAEISEESLVEEQAQRHYCDENKMEGDKNQKVTICDNKTIDKAPVEAVESHEDKMDIDDIDDESDRMSVDTFNFDLSDDEVEEMKESENISTFSRSIDLDLIVKTIEAGETTMKQVEDRDCVLIIGKTGTGKSSLIQALAGKKFAESEHISSLKSDVAKKVVYHAIDPLQDFPIGHETKSKTSTIKCFDPNSVESDGKKLMFVDSPGFEDTRGYEVDIATSVLLSQVASRCRSLRFVIMISFVSLLEDRGGSMRSILRLIHTFTRNFEEEKQNFMFLFSHANEIKGIPDSIDGAKKSLRDEIIRTMEGTIDEETKRVLHHIQTCLKKNHPFVDVFMPLQTNGLHLGESIQKYLKGAKNPHIAENCILTSQSLLSLCGQLQHALIKLRRDIGTDNHPIESICDSFRLFEVLGGCINVEDIRNIKQEVESLLSTFIQTHISTIEKGIGQLTSTNQDFGDTDVINVKKAFSTVEVLAQKFPNMVNCQEIESRVKEQLDSFCSSLLLKLGQSFDGVEKNLSKLMVWCNNFPSHQYFYTDVKNHLITVMDDCTTKCSVERRDLDILLEKHDMSEMWQCLGVLDSIENDKDLLAVHGLDTHRASKVYHTLLSNIESTIQKWIDRIQVELKDMHLDEKKISILSEISLRLDEMNVLMDKYFSRQDFKQKLSNSRMQLVCDINNYFESIGSELETSTANPDILKRALIQTELASKSFHKIGNGLFRQISVTHERIVDKVKSELMKLVGQVDQISEEIKRIGVKEGVKYATLFRTLKAMNWFDDMLPDAAFVRNVLISFERTISDRNTHVGMEIETVMNQIISDSCDLNVPCKTFESLLLELKQISLFGHQTNLPDFTSIETKVVKDFREYVSSLTDGNKDHPRQWKDLLISSRTKSNMEKIDSKSEEIECILRKMKALNGIDSFSDSKLRSLFSLVDEASEEISASMRSIVEVKEAYEEKLHFLKILRTINKYSTIKKYLPDIKELQGCVRSVVASHAKDIEDIVSQTSEWDLIDSLLSQLEEARVLDEFTQNEASSRLSPLLKLRRQKQEEVDKHLDELIISEDFRGIGEFLIPYAESKDQITVSKFNKWLEKISSTLSETIGSVSRSLDGDIVTEDTCENIAKNLHKLNLAKTQLRKYLTKLPGGLNLEVEFTELRRELNKKFSSLISDLDRVTVAYDFEGMGVKNHLIGVYKNSKLMNYIWEKHKKKEKSCQRNYQTAIRYVPKAMSKYVESNFADNTEFFNILHTLKNSSLCESPSFPILQELYKNTINSLVIKLNEIVEALCESVLKTDCFDDAIGILCLLDKHLNQILKEHIDGTSFLSFRSDELLRDWRDAKQKKDREMEFNGTDVEKKLIQWKSMLDGLDPSKSFFLSRQYKQWYSGTTYQRKQREISNIARDRSKKAERALREGNYILLEECINVLDLIEKHLSSHVSGSGEFSKSLQQKAITRFLSLCEKLQKILQSKKPAQFQDLFGDYRGYVLHTQCILRNNKCKREFSLTNQFLHEKLSSEVQEITQMFDVCEFDKIYRAVRKVTEFGDFVADHFTLLKEELSCSDHDQDQDGWLQKIFDICVEHFSNGRILSHLKDFATLELAPSSGKGGVNKAYKRLAKKYHPDKNPSADANEVFRTLTEAKDRLIEAIDSKKESESPFGSLIKDVGRSLRKKIKSLMDEQRYDRVENILFAMKDLKSLKSLVTPNLDVTDITNDIHSLVKSYVQKAKTAVSTNWAEKQYKSLNYNITDLRMMEERFKSYANIFPSSWNDGIVEQIEEKIIKVGQQARGYLSSEKSAKKHKDDFRRCFIEMGSVLVELPLFKDFTKAEMCNVLEACLNFNGGYSFLFEFGLSLKKNDDNGSEEENNIAQMLLAEFSQFKEVMTMVWNEETSQKPAEDTVKGIKGIRRDGDIESELPLDRDLLLERFHIFEAEYKKLLGEYIAPEVDLQLLVVKIKKLSNKLQPIDMKHGWTNKVKEQIPYILAGVFTVFTVLKSGASYNRIDTSSDGNGGDKLLMKPHNIQVLTLLSLFGCGSSSSSSPELQSQLMQIRTGEGKSMILGAASVVLALLGFRVRCVCYSDYLSTRDYNLFQDIFETFSVTDSVKYSKITTLSEDTTAAKGNIRHMTNAMLKGNIYKSYNNTSSNLPRLVTSEVRDDMSETISTASQRTLSKDSRKQQKNKRKKRKNETSIVSSANAKRHNSQAQQEILLVDEVDVFFGGDFYGQTYNQVAQFREPEIESILKHIWMVNKRSSRRQRLSDIKSLPSYRSLLKKMPNFQFLVDAEISLMIDQVRKVDEEPYYLDREADKIGYKVMDSISYSVTYGYCTVFAYLKEADKGNLKNEEETLRRELCMPVSCGQFSYAEISPHCILGVSGTLSALGNFEYEVLAKYGVGTYLFVPSVYGESNFQFDKAGSGIRIDTSLSDYFHSITDQIKELTKQKRAVIVFFENNARLQEFVNSPFYGKLGRQKKLLTENLTRGEKEFVISKAATSRQITLSTAVFGRGTDFFCKDESVIRNGGVHVIQTFLSEELSEEIQIQGRTARQGKKGSYEMLLLASDLSEKYGLSHDMKDNIAKEDLYKELCRTREKLRSKHHVTIEENLVEATSKDRATHSYFDLLLQTKYDEATKKFKDIYQSFKKRQMPSSIQLDISFVLDITGSMAPYVASIMNTVSMILRGNNSIVEKLKLKFPDMEFSIRVAALGYRDFDDIQQFLETTFSHGCHFTDDINHFISDLQALTQNPSGGGDIAEDHLGAIDTCSKWNSDDDWTSPIKFMLLFTDAPTHGMVSEGSRGLSNVDNSPKRHPLGITGESVVESLIESEIDLFLCSFNPSATSLTEKTLSTLYLNHPRNTEQKEIISIPMIPENRDIVLAETQTARGEVTGNHGKHIIFVLDMSYSMNQDWSGVVEAYKKYIACRKQTQSESGFSCTI